MVQTNKILTVSYGTFSCTLEGFDDSFETMKAIAEYFRDLAADDRYFGAEPPQPDAEMLARIAQKEIARQVEAHQDNNGILLRAGAPALQPAESPAPAPAAPVAETPAQEPAVKAEPDDMTPEPAAEAPEPVAAEPEEVDAPEADNVVEIIEPVAPKPVASGESMADKLARIRAVVERNDAIVEDQIEDAEEPVIHDYSEPEVDQDADDQDFAEEYELTADALVDQEVPSDDTPEIADVEPAALHDTAAEADETADVIGSVLAATEFEEPARTDTPVLDADEFEYADEDVDEDESLFRDLADEDDGEIDELAEGQTDDLVEEDENLLTPPEEQPTARAVKVKTSEIEQAIAENGFEEVAAATEATETTADSSLSPEDEADLQAELDAVAAELAEAQAALNPPDELDDQTVVSPRAREGRADAIKGSTPPVTRLLKETEGKMEDPESALSREAYDHLRAAVVATRAEASATQGDDKPKAITDAAYRDDLANVVRPRRPDAGGAAPRSRRPDDNRPAPLKLVAEQRIDADSILPQRGPIRPRRVAAEAEEGSEDGQQKPSGFAAFAQEVGAKELPELLEAAAAYMSFVEGWEQFSRPQLMTRVKQVENSGFNREDGLRTFGQLLREGKIEKTSGGRFTASERIGFRPARKAVG